MLDHGDFEMRHLDQQGIHCSERLQPKATQLRVHEALMEGPQVLQEDGVLPTQVDHERVQVDEVLVGRKLRHGLAHASEHRLPRETNLRFRGFGGERL